MSKYPPVCTNCDYIYPIPLIKDLNRKLWVCPGCGYTMKFRKGD